PGPPRHPGTGHLHTERRLALRHKDATQRPGQVWQPLRPGSCSGTMLPAPAASVPDCSGRTGAGKPRAAKTWGWKRICPQPQPPAPVIPVGRWHRTSSRRRAPAAGTAAATCPGAGGNEGGLPALLPRPQDQGCGQQGLHAPRLFTLSSLQVAGRERGWQRDVTAGLRIPYSGAAAPRLSATAGTPASAPLSGGMLGPGGPGGPTSASCLGPCFY
ncbi:hypothetical protein H8959_007749, partial [Pygathrix nigripes]